MEFEFKFRKPLEKKWLVVYVRPRWEKKVDILLTQLSIECFCPTTTTENQWADRKKMVTKPLFTGYVFVRINDRDLTKVRSTMGVLNYIYFMGKPAVIRDLEIEQLKTMVNNYDNLQVVNLNELTPGDRVRIRSGVFHNQEGNIIQIQGKKVLMSFDHLYSALVTCLPIDQVVKTSLRNTLHNAG